MKVSLNWLKRYVDIPVSAKELETVFPQLGLEVENMSQHGVPPLENVVVGEILTKQKHPNADRLTVCTVDVGHSDPLNIVCGATNHEVGHRVFVALPGAVLPGEFKIKKGNLRGVPSEGMMCSGSEIGLSTDAKGLYILTDRPKVGLSINTVMPEGDVVYDLAITANRMDALCHLGIAADLAAYFNLPLKEPKIETLPVVCQKSGLIGLRLEAPHCSYYTATTIMGLSIQESPEWMRKDLEVIGLRPINNVVDITNWVMMEMGQPLHAFDADKIEGKALIVRSAKAGEEVITLDGKKRVLSEKITVIADEKKILAIAGVMGAQNSQVDEHTKTVVLESAYFDPNAIRSAVAYLGLSSDSAYRFERGVDPAVVTKAKDRALQLFNEGEGVKAAGECLEKGVLPIAGHIIKTSFLEIETILGFKVEKDLIVGVFHRLGMTVREEEDSLCVEVPSARREVAFAEDLAEEFLRIVGTDKIPGGRVVLKSNCREDASIGMLSEAVAESWAGAGFAECMHYTLLSQKKVALMGSNFEDLKLDNPLSVDQAYLRPSLLPCLLDALSLNLNNGRDVRRLFEIGHVFLPKKEGVEEALSFAFLMLEKPIGQFWKEPIKADFYAARKVIGEAASTLGLSLLLQNWEQYEASTFWQPGHSAYHSEGASVGLVNFNALKEWGISEAVFAGELIMPLSYFKKAQKQKMYVSFSIYPSVKKDIALLVDKAEKAEDVVLVVSSAAKASTGPSFAVEAVKVFDVYEGSELPQRTKSLAISIAFRAMDRTLTDDEVNQAFNNLQTRLKEAGYTLRV